MEDLVKKTLKECRICKEYNVPSRKPYRRVEAFEPGEKVAIDLMGPIRKHYIITALDYFTRKAWAKRINSKHDHKIIGFIEQVNRECPIKTLWCDQAKENTSKELQKWLKDNGIEQHVTTPYHPQSNGKIERFHRTFMDGLNKAKKKGSYDSRIKRVIEAYNETWHTALGMSPNEAWNPNNWARLKKNTYSRILNSDKKVSDEIYPPINLGQSVLIANQPQRKKSEPRFLKIGIVKEKLEGDTYLILVGKQLIKRHAIQLKVL